MLSDTSVRLRMELLGHYCVLPDAVLVRIQSDHAPSVWAGAAPFLLQSQLCKHKCHLDRNPASFDVGGSSFGSVSVLENG